MANPEACELYIEQQIEEGLEEGQTPYYIGKHLSGWIEKLFETKINPSTLKTRAYRKQQEIGSDEPKESNQEQKEIVIPDDIPSLTDAGGQRKGAGRKSKIKRRRLTDIEKEGIVSDEFNTAYREFYDQVILAMHDKWRTTSKEAVVKCANNIIDLVFVK